MKYKITIFFFLWNLHLFATDYYVSGTGLDTNNGLSTGTPFLTIDKVNSIWSTLSPGDRVLFNKGDVFFGALKVSKSGTPASKITIGSYGIGARPIITGFKSVTGWAVSTGSIYVSSVITGASYKPKMVTKDNYPLQIGRWPNTGYRSFNSSAGNVSITDLTLPSSPNLTGADVSIKKIHHVIGCDSITSHVGTTINYLGLTGYNTLAGYGYIISNSLSTLDVQNEWYYDKTATKLYMYSSSTPTGIKIACIDTLLAIRQFDYITVDGIDFEGSNVASIAFNLTTNPSLGITIKNCIINDCGRDAIYATNNTGSLIDSNTISHTLNNGILLESEGGRSQNATVTHNMFLSIGMYAGMGYWNAPNGYNTSMNGVTCFGDNFLCMFNELDSTGNVPIAVYYNGFKISKNFIRYFCHRADDGGGVNVFDNSPGGLVLESGREISYNIILDGIGAPEGTPLNDRVVHDIYMDDKSDSIAVFMNVCGTSATGGIYCHNCTRMNIRDNIVYNCTAASISFVHDNHATGMPIRNMRVTSNVFFGVNSSQQLNYIATQRHDIDTMFFALDSNYYSRPAAVSGNTIKTRTYYAISGLDSTGNYTLTTFKSAHIIYEVHGRSTAANTLTSRLYYNPTDAIVTLNLLDTIKYDPKGVRYVGLVPLSRYGGLILIDSGFQTGITIPPTANAGADKSITLPTSSTSVTATGTNGSGTSRTYHWYQTGGPITAVIATPNSATTNISGMTTDGEYQFSVDVTNNLGDVASDNMKVVVSPAVTPPNDPPVARIVVTPGTTITLPISSVLLDGSTSSDDVSIGSYTWTEVSGPNLATNSSPSGSSTTMGGMVVGLYIFKLDVTDNLGVHGVKQVTITVNPATVLINPTANAGPNQTWPTPIDSAVLVGSGTAQPGATIISYQWKEGATVLGTTSTLTVHSLSVGLHTFTLTVTDSNSLTGTDTIDVNIYVPAPETVAYLLLYEIHNN